MEELLERLKRLEELVGQVLERLEELEALLRSVDSEAAIAARLALALSLPAARAIEAARRAAETLAGRSHLLDAIDRSIIEAMSTCEELTVAELARRLRRLRGASSRTTIRSRLRRLVEMGLVEMVEHGSRRLYRLRGCGG